MKIYVIHHRWSYEDNEVVGVMDSQEAASEWVKELEAKPESPYSEYWEEEFELGDKSYTGG